MFSPHLGKHGDVGRSLATLGHVGTGPGSTEHDGSVDPPARPIAPEAGGLDPLRLSFTGALREIGDLLPAPITNLPCRVRCVQMPRSLDRMAAHLVPDRPGRHYPSPIGTKTRDMRYGRKNKPGSVVV